MAKVIEGLYYSESHEYVRVEGDFCFIGITDYAQHALGNVVYVDMPDVDDEVTAGEEFGAVESVKAASDLYSPVSGTVVEVNEARIHTKVIIREVCIVTHHREFVALGQLGIFCTLYRSRYLVSAKIISWQAVAFAAFLRKFED